VTTNYPSGTTPTGPDNLPPDRDADAAWGCLWWWWIVILIVVLIFWFSGWGWGPYGGWWFRGRRANPSGPGGPATRPTVTSAPSADDTAEPPSTHLIRLEIPRRGWSLAGITLEFPWRG